MFSQINDLQGKVLKNAADKITQILMQDGIDFEVANDIGTNLAMVELDKLQEKYEQMENIVNSVKEPKDIWNLLLGHVLGGTKSQSAKVLKEFIKKRVTPWVDFTTDLLVLIALYEQDLLKYGRVLIKVQPKPRAQQRARTRSSGVGGEY